MFFPDVVPGDVSFMGGGGQPLDVAKKSSEAALLSHDLTTDSHEESTITADESTITADESAITADKSAITAGESTITAGESTITAGESTVVQVSRFEHSVTFQDEHLLNSPEVHETDVTSKQTTLANDYQATGMHPGTSNDVLIATDNTPSIPKASDDVPRTSSDVVSNMPDVIPNSSDSTARTSNNDTTMSDLIPNTSDDVPTTSDDVPTTSDDVPTILPNTSDIVPDMVNSDNYHESTAKVQEMNIHVNGNNVVQENEKQDFQRQSSTDSEPCVSDSKI